MAIESPPLVQLTDVSKTYGEHNVTALSQINLSVRAGEFVAIMGPSGCGKSTLLNVIGAIDTVDRGSVVLDGRNLRGLSDSDLTELRRTKIGFVFQFFNLLSTLTVSENVALPLQLQKKNNSQIRSMVKTTLERVGMSSRADFYPAQLSGGEMQRVALARAIIHSPALLIADEPTGNLDSESGASALALIKALNQEGGNTIVMATHSSEAASSADRIVVMRDGKIANE